VRGLLPEIRAAAEETERNRSVSPAIMKKIGDAGLFRICQPKRFGGFELGCEVPVRAVTAFATACPSTAWCAAVGMGHHWFLSLFPPQAQHDVWDVDPNYYACASYAPVGRAVQADGGYRLSGTFAFASGCDYAGWAIVGAMIVPPGAAPPRDPSFFIVPASDYVIEDNWFTSGLVGTGSKNVVIRDAFVPTHRRLPFAVAVSGDTPGGKLHDNPLYRIPMLAFVPALLATTAVGAAKGALQEYVEMTRVRQTRGAVAGGNIRMAEFATIQLRVAEAAAATDAAETVVLSDLRELSGKVEAGEEVTVADRIRYRRGQAFATKLAIEAVEALNASTGGSGLFLHNIVQRHWRDANAVGRHISLNWDTVGTMYGQHALGLEPRGQY
jgi:resorcinol 4-hydroxylase (FADH2)